jgi:ribose/xylose/arabinose/galactoside ABC-type transport system permease subunit
VTSSTAAVTRLRRETDWAHLFSSYGVYVGILALILLNTLQNPNFLAYPSLRLQLVQVVPVAIVSLGLALVIGTRGIDISLGSVMAVAAATLAAFLWLGPIPAIIAALVAGMLLGAINGTLVAYAGIQPIVATLGMLVAGRGLALVIAEGRLTEIFDPLLGSLGSGSLPIPYAETFEAVAPFAAGVPFVILITLLIAAAIAFVVGRTTFGRYILATGGNPSAARLSGVPVKPTLLAVYVVSALLAAVAGIIATARTGASDPSFLGNLIELSAISAVVVGGTPFSGGKVRILGTLAGALFMQLIEATLIRNNLSDSVARMVAAVIIVSAVFIQREREG